MEETLLEYHKNNKTEGFVEVSRSFGQKATIEDKPAVDGSIINNSMLIGASTTIVDEKAIEELLDMYDKEEKFENSNILTMLIQIKQIVYKYFHSKDTINEFNREETYARNCIKNENGEVIGTNLSSLKGKNIAKCSEETIAGYIILNTLYRKGDITRKPSILLTELGTDDVKSGPHACLLLDKENAKDNDPTKHLLFDILNLCKITDQNQEDSAIVGLYTLTDQEHKDLLEGYKCTPHHIIEYMSTNYKITSKQCIFGQVNKRDVEDPDTDEQNR